MQAIIPPNDALNSLLAHDFDDTPVLKENFYEGDIKVSILYSGGELKGISLGEKKRERVRRLLC